MKVWTVDTKRQGDTAPQAGSSAWAPFRSPDFARMASAQFVSNVGSWMQTVGAQELMLTLTTSATLVALIQTAAGLPVVLLAVPAGAIGDLVDRRRLLIASQSFMLLAALALAGLALAGLVTPRVLLALIFAVGSGGYGLLLAGVGVGAVAGAATLPRLRARVSAQAMMTSGTVVFAVVTLALGYVRASALAALVLVVGGIAWILMLSTLNSQYQTTLPGWAKARGMSYYLVIFQGGGALGSAAFGVIAQNAGLSEALLAAAVGLALVALAGVWLPFKVISPVDLLPAGDWPDPQLLDAGETDGPVLVTLEYRPMPGLERDLVDALYAGRHARRRTGAVSWRVWRDAADSGRVLEQFVVGSWDEHLRQHERVSRRDQQRLDEVRAMTDPSRPTTVTHWLAPQLSRTHPPTPPSDGLD